MSVSFVSMSHISLVTSPSLCLVCFAGRDVEARTWRELILDGNSLRPFHTRFRPSIQAVDIAIQGFNVTKTGRSPLGQCNVRGLSTLC